MNTTDAHPIAITQVHSADTSQTNARDTLAILSPSDPVKVALDQQAPGVLVSERLMLRPLDESDRSAFCTLIAASRSHLQAFSPLHMPDETDDALFDRQLARTKEGEHTGKACRRMICLLNGSMIGACNLNAIRRGLSAEADCNWWLAPHATGLGYATEALGLLMTHAFADMPAGLGLFRVLAGIQQENTASIALARRLGFERLSDEATYLHAADQWKLHDMYVLNCDAFLDQQRHERPRRNPS